MQNDEYGVLEKEGDTLYVRYALDDNGQRIAGDTGTVVSAEEAVPALIDDYLNRSYTEVGSGDKEGHVRLSYDEFRDLVLKPAYEEVIRTTPPDEQDAKLRQVFGNNDKIIAIIQDWNPELAYRLWFDRAAIAAEPLAEPTEPTPTPAKVIHHSGQPQPPPSLQPAPDPPPNLPNTSNTGHTSKGGDPVILFSGQLYHQVTDLEVSGRGLHLQFTRTYLHQTAYKGPLGYSWDHSYNLWLREEQETEPGGAVRNVVYRSTGEVRADRYTQILDAPIEPLPAAANFPDAVFQPPPATFEKLTKENGLYVLELVSGIRIYYGTEFQAERIVDLNGNEMRLKYDPDRHLMKVTDPVGKQFLFDYDELNRLRRVRDEEGHREVLYTFGDNGDLEGVDIRPDGEEASETDYEYLGPDRPLELQHNLVRIINPFGNAALDVEYGEDQPAWEYNRVVWQRAESGEFQYEYEPIPTEVDWPLDGGGDQLAFAHYSTTVTGPRGQVVEHRFNVQGNVVQRAEYLVVDGVQQLALAAFRYNADGLVVSETFADGSGSDYSYEREAYEELNGGDASGASPDERLRFGLLRKTLVRPRIGIGEDRRIVTDYTYTDARRLESVRGPYYTDPFLHELPNQAVTSLSYVYDNRQNLQEADYPQVTLPTGGSLQVPPRNFTVNPSGNPTDIVFAGLRTHFDYFPDLLRSGYVSQRIDDADGAALTTVFETDTLGRVTRTTSPLGAVDESVWNGFDLVRQAIRRDPNRPPSTTETRYDVNRMPRHRSMQIFDESGAPLPDAPLLSDWCYDDFGRVVQEGWGTSKSPAERIRRLVLGPDGQVDREFDPRGFEFRQIRDELGRVIETVRAPDRLESSTRRYDYDISGKVTRVTDGLGHVTTLQYDGFGRVRLIRDPDSNEIETEYDAAGQPVRSVIRGVHPDIGQVVRWSEVEFLYDELGQLIRRDDHLFEPGSAGQDVILSALFVRDAFGRVTETHDATGAVWVMGYDGLGRTTALTDPDGNQSTWRYDDAQRLIEFTREMKGTDPFGNPLTYVFRETTYMDARGLEIEYVDRAGNRSAAAYDSRDLPTLSKDAAGEPTIFRRDAYGQVRAVIRPFGDGFVQVTRSYDENGNLTELDDPNGNAIIWQYDALDRAASETRGSATRIFQYDPEDRPVTLQDENGVVISLSYTPGGQLSTRSADLTNFSAPLSDAGYSPVPAGPSTFVYTPAGSIAHATNDAGTVHRTFDSLGRMTTDAHDQLTVGLSYDGVGRIHGIVYPDGRMMSFVYSPAGSLMRISQTAAGANYPGSANAPAARPLAVFHRVAATASGIDYGPCTVTLSYDMALRPVGADWRTANGGGPVAIERRLYGSRNESRLEQTNDRIRISASDVLGRQTGAEDQTGVVTVDVSSLTPPGKAAELSDQGQALEDALPQPGPGVFARSVAYSLDANTNRTATTEVPANGAQPEMDAYTVGSFDAYTDVGPDAVLNDSAGNTIGIGGKRFRYDPYHALAEIQFQGTTVTLRRDALGRLSHIQTMGSDLRLVYAGLDSIEWRANGGTAGQVVRYDSRICHLAAGLNDYVPVSDLSGSIVGWVDPTGVQVGSSVYDPFGKLISRSGVWPAPFGFRGYLVEEMSELALLHARGYDPALGRFLQRDPLGYADGTNLYAYAGHAPDRMTDEWGFEAVEHGWKDQLGRSAAVEQPWYERRVGGGASQSSKGSRLAPAMPSSRIRLHPPGNDDGMQGAARIGLPTDGGITPGNREAANMAAHDHADIFSQLSRERANKLQGNVPFENKRSVFPNAVFWSGGPLFGGSLNYYSAEAFARLHRYPTLESTYGGFVMTLANMVVGDSAVTGLIWTVLGDRFAAAASGVVHAFVHPMGGLNITGFFTLHELPILLKNPNVSAIEFHYPATGAIWGRLVHEGRDWVPEGFPELKVIEAIRRLLRGDFGSWRPF
jgi:RHS repeat-associated protein